MVSFQPNLPQRPYDETFYDLPPEIPGLQLQPARRRGPPRPPAEQEDIRFAERMRRQILRCIRHPGQAPPTTPELDRYQRILEQRQETRRHVQHNERLAQQVASRTDVSSSQARRKESRESGIPIHQVALLSIVLGTSQVLGWIADSPKIQQYGLTASGIVFVAASWSGVWAGRKADV
jgi:hypothetical protein